MDKKPDIMPIAKPDSETVWTKEFPHKIGFYWCRTEQYRELPAEFDGRSVSTLYGVRLFADDVLGLQPEFLGPISPSDFEELIRLREAGEVVDAAARFALMTPGFIRGRDQLLAATDMLRRGLDTNERR